MTNPERRSALTANWALLVTVLLCAFLVIERVGAVIELAGFSGHKDETYVYRSVLRVIEGPDLNPEFFSYPSLPFYMSAAAIKLGTWIEGPTELQRGHLFRIPGRQGEPHEPERLVLYARVLWALIGAALFVAVALLARQLSGSYTWAWIAPGILAFSELVQYQAVRYQNVDSPTSLFAVLTLIAVLHGWKSDSLWWKAVLPGILAGLTTACKYNSGLILAPCLLAILLAPGSTRFLTKAVVLGFTSAVTFFVVVPYSILDFNGFYEGVMYQVNHYRDGHPGFEGPTGLPQIWFYLTAFYKEFGITVSLLAIAGIFFSLKSRPRETLVVMAFPVLMILYMSTNKVHFLRTVMPVFVLIPVFAALGTAGIFGLLKSLMISPIWRNIGAAATGIVLVSLVVMTSNTAVWADRNIEPDIREAVVEWIHANIPADKTILLASDLWFRAGDLGAYEVTVIPPDLPESDLSQAVALSSGGSVLVVPEYRLPGVPIDLRNETEKAEAYRELSADRLNGIEQRIEDVVTANEGELMHSWKGRPMTLHPIQGRRTHSTENPAVLIYRLN